MAIFGPLGRTIAAYLAAIEARLDIVERFVSREKWGID